MPHIRPRVITALDVEGSAARSVPTSGQEGSPPKEDGYLAKLIKYIPAEAIATHQALAGFGSGGHEKAVGWLAVLLLPLSIPWFIFGTKDKGEDPAWSQIILCPIAFAIWMLVVQSPAVQVLFGRQLLDPTLGSIVLMVATAAMPVIERLIESVIRRIK